MDRGLFEMAPPSAAQEFDSGPFETGEFEGEALASRAGEQYVDTSQWQTDPLRGHGGTGANLLLRWNDVAESAKSIDVVVHLHGYISRDPDAGMLRAVAARSGLDLSGRQRLTLAIVPRGRRITKEEVNNKQALLNEAARRAGRKPGTARADVYTFPALSRGDGAGIAALINGALEWFARNKLGRGTGATLPVARLIFTAHSGGGAALDRLLALHARSKACNPDEVQAFDALYAKAAGLQSWATARLRADRSRAGGQMDVAGGGLRLFYRPGGGTQSWSELIGRSLLPRSDPLSRFYRSESTRVAHLDIPNAFGPALLRDRSADVASPQPRAVGTTPSPAAPAGARQAPVTPMRAPLPGDVQAWVRSTERSAIELVAAEALRRKLLREIDWSGEYFPGNLDAQKRTAPGRLAQNLFDAMARVTPERRVPSSIRYRRDIAAIVVPIPGVPGKKLHPEAAAAFVRLRAAAAKDGIAIRLLPGARTAWRSAADQAAIRQGQPNPLAAAAGVSPHMYGLAVDLRLGVRGLPIAEANTRTPEKMANIVRMYRSPIYKWLVLNASRFGWFPYRREPWHWEYNPPGFAARFEVAPLAREYEAEDMWAEEVKKTAPACENRIATVTIWLNAFIPGEVSGLTRKVPALGAKLDPSMAGKTMFATAFGCGLTDQRSLSADIDASSRMHSEAKIDLDRPRIIYQKHRIDPSVQVDCMTGQVVCKGTSSTDPMKFTFVGVTAAKEIMIHVKGSQGPACPKSKMLMKAGQILLDAKIDYEGTFFITRVARNYVDISFLGKVDLFPAYEFVVTLNDSNPVHLGGRLPAAGSSPVTHLGTKQKIHFKRRLWLQCRNGKQLAGVYERTIG